MEKSELRQLLGFYYLVAWKSYPKNKNTWKPLSAVQHFKKLISSFHKNYLEKLITTFLLINSLTAIASLIVKPTKLTTKQKQGRSANSARKQATN